VVVTFFFVGLFISIYVIAAGVIIALLIYEWYFLIRPRRRRKP